MADAPSLWDRESRFQPLQIGSVEISILKSDASRAAHEFREIENRDPGRFQSPIFLYLRLKSDVCWSFRSSCRAENRDFSRREWAISVCISARIQMFVDRYTHSAATGLAISPTRTRLLLAVSPPEFRCSLSVIRQFRGIQYRDSNRFKSAILSRVSA